MPLEHQQPVGEERSNNPRKNGIGNGSNVGVWFCREKCRTTWIADGEKTTNMEHGGVRGVVNAALERCLASMGKDKSKLRITPQSSEIELEWMSFLQSLEDLECGRDMSSAFLDDAWNRAERLSSFSRSSTPTIPTAKNPVSTRRSEKGETGRALLSPTLLSEFEVDTARFVLAGLLRKCIEDFTQSQMRPSESEPIPGNGPTTPGVDYPCGSWSDVLDLQDSTLLHIQSKPHILASSVRIWAFNKFIVHSALRDTKHLSEQTNTLGKLFKEAVDVPRDTRVILGREHGNVFGIWDTAPEGVDSEMLGWGLYSLGSYFNHGEYSFAASIPCLTTRLDCSPTLRKKRNGRVMEYYTLRDVDKGEELCISYVDNNEDVVKRKAALREWFFDCICGKCEMDLRNPAVIIS